jgi:chromosome segregation ATPase
MKQKSLNTENV